MHLSGLQFPSPEDLPSPGIEPTFPTFPASPALQADSLPSEPLGKPTYLMAKKIKQNIKQKQYCNKFSTDFKNGPHKKRIILKKSFVEGLKYILVMTIWKVYFP